MKLSRLALACLAAGLSLAACSPPKYVHYWSVWRDWHANVGWAWNIMTDQEGGHFENTNFIGPFAREFYLGVPSISVRYYAYKTGHRLPDGLTEYYKDADDYIKQTLTTVYGPHCADFWDENTPPQNQVSVEDTSIDRPCALVGVTKDKKLIAKGHPDEIYLGDGRKAKHFIVLSPVQVPQAVAYGTRVDDKTGAKYVLRMHEYAVVPMQKGFYVVIYPATRDGYDRFKPYYNEFLNTLKFVREGPGASPAAPLAAGRGKK